MNVRKAELVNILEDNICDLECSLTSNDKFDKPDCTLKLDFRAFEVKSVRLTIQGEKKRRSSGAGGWVKL